MPAGLENVVVSDRVGIREAVIVFREKLSDRVDAVQLILFGGGVYGDVHDENDTDAAVVLAGLPMNFA